LRQTLFDSDAEGNAAATDGESTPVASRGRQRLDADDDGTSDDLDRATDVLSTRATSSTDAGDRDEAHGDAQACRDDGVHCRSASGPSAAAVGSLAGFLQLPFPPPEEFAPPPLPLDDVESTEAAAVTAAVGPDDAELVLGGGVGVGHDEFGRCE